MKDTDAVVIACTALVVCSLGAATTMLAAVKKLKHSTWVKQYIKDRYRYGAYSTLLLEPSRYVQYLMMNVIVHSRNSLHL